MEQQFEDDDSQEDDDATHNDQPKKVRKNLATINVPFKGPNESIIFSYHYKYEKYLRDNNLIDVSICVLYVSHYNPVLLFIAGKSKVVSRTFKKEATTTNREKQKSR